MTDKKEKKADHIPDVRKKVLDANNLANLSNEPICDEENGGNAKDMDTAELIELGKAAFERFCEEYEIQGLVSESEQDGFEAGYRYAIQSQSAETQSNMQNVHNADGVNAVALVNKLNQLAASEYSSNNAQGLPRFTSPLERTLEEASDALEALTAALAKSEARVKELEDSHPVWFMWRPKGKIPVIKGPFMETWQAVRFGGELYEIHQKHRVSVLSGWAPNKLEGDSIENFMSMYGDRRRSVVKQYNKEAHQALKGGAS